MGFHGFDEKNMKTLIPKNININIFINIIFVIIFIFIFTNYLLL